VKVIEIIISAGRTFNHPYEHFSNLRPQLTLKASLTEGEDAEKAIKDLQAKAESLLEDHKGHMLDSLERLHEMREYERHVSSLEDRIKAAQREIEALREKKQCLLPGMEESK
jgi:flagellar biosynthesis chaperone FliJ